MNKKKVTMTDIAARTGLSQSTISMILSRCTTPGFIQSEPYICSDRLENKSKKGVHQ